MLWPKSIIEITSPKEDNYFFFFSFEVSLGCVRYFQFGLELNKNLLLVNIIITYFIPLEVFHT